MPRKSVCARECLTFTVNTYSTICADSAQKCVRNASPSRCGRWRSRPGCPWLPGPNRWTELRRTPSKQTSILKWGKSSTFRTVRHNYFAGLVVGAWGQVYSRLATAAAIQYKHLFPDSLRNFREKDREREKERKREPSAPRGSWTGVLVAEINFRILIHTAYPCCKDNVCFCLPIDAIKEISKAIPAAMKLPANYPMLPMSSLSSISAIPVAYSYSSY